jgi:hypothetical protein
MEFEPTIPVSERAKTEQPLWSIRIFMVYSKSIRPSVTTNCTQDKTDDKRDKTDDKSVFDVPVRNRKRRVKINMNMTSTEGTGFREWFWVMSRRIHNHTLLSHLRLLQHGGPGPQEYGGPVIPPGTGFPFCLLLRLAGLRWRYFNPPPHGELTHVILSDQSQSQSQSQSYITDDSRPVCLDLWDPRPIFLLPSLITF